ncbi:endoplasmic reticulum membrane protein [Encephalitozoon intestinalis ATCC 50506]|uniref:Derlin n=1 Tax=Encephalitozoon intestinalis (strain ATCC 50506) TaxID=876142 RepID=E0SA59_ENCIT|nr:endoplasmic reticulum membrane protein [Encephalitozoon intestinalis ATCC 50506]ADM12681.1 endoplasmic reticulum membrane protein [Encephalitozoon intestinalis ATCC 50506]UTX46542.1 endoplasmic reticulum membrane protein [Encephalitozoon intestinalis]
MNNDLLLGQILRVPPITRCMVLLITMVSLLVYVDAVSPYSLYYSPLFLRKFEVWRIFTSFLYFGKPTLDMFMHVVFLYRYSRMLEEGCINTSEYFWLVLVISSTLFAISNIYGISALGTSFSSTITYIWTKRNPRAIVQIFGFISFPAFYLPFILPGFMLLTRRSISIDDVLGIVVGHLFHYFKDIYPRWGRDILKTPCWVKKLFKEHPSGCCKTQKGITIREGREKYKRNIENGNFAKTDENNEVGLIDATDPEINKVDDEYVGEESPSQSCTESLREKDLSIAFSQRPSIVSSTVMTSSIGPEENCLGVVEACSSKEPVAGNDPESRSNEEWDEKWGESDNESTG